MVERVPLFLLREGRLVRQDGPRAWTPLTRSSDESVRRIREAARPDALVYILDIDGVEAEAADHEFYQKLERAHVLSWIQPGCRTPEDAMDAFFAGAEAITIEPRLLKTGALEDLAQLTEGEVHLGFPFGPARPEPDLHAHEMARLAKQVNAAGIVLEATSGTDAHRLKAFLSDLASHGVPMSLLDRRGPPAPAPSWEIDLLDHVIGPGAPP